MRTFSTSFTHNTSQPVRNAGDTTSYNIQVFKWENKQALTSYEATNGQDSYISSHCSNCIKLSNTKTANYPKLDYTFHLFISNQN